MKLYWISVGIVLVLGVSAALGLGVVCADTGASGDDSTAPLPGAESPAVPQRAEVVDPPPTHEDVARAYASARARQPQDTDWGGGDPAAGAALFAEHCAICHGAGGAGGGPAAVALNPKPRDFTDGTFYIDADANNVTGEDVDLARVILEGPAAFGGSDAMLGWDEVFDDDGVRDLIAHIRTLAR